MKAMPYEADKFCGDSEYYAPDGAVEYNDGDSFDVLAARVAEQLDISPEELEDLEITPIAGFWLLRDADIETVDVLWGEHEQNSDTMTYSTNRAAKRLCERLAFAEMTPDNNVAVRPSVER